MSFYPQSFGTIRSRILTPRPSYRPETSRVLLTPRDVESMSNEPRTEPRHVTSRYPFNLNFGQISHVYNRLRETIMMRICGSQYQKFIEDKVPNSKWYLVGDRGITEFIYNYITTSRPLLININGSLKRLDALNLRRLIVYLMNGTDDFMGNYSRKWRPMSEVFLNRLVPLKIDLSKIVQCNTKNEFKIINEKYYNFVVKCIVKPPEPRLEEPIMYNFAPYIPVSAPSIRSEELSHPDYYLGDTLGYDPEYPYDHL
jgi:hypothetical protein